MESSPPCNRDAEAAFLGSLMFNRGAFDLPSCALVPDDFHSERHRTVYEAALAMKADGVPVDYVTLTDRLARDGTLGKAGGYEGVDKIADAAPHAAHAPFYAAAVRAKSRERFTLYAMNEADKADPSAAAAAVLAVGERFPELDAAGPDGAASVTLADLIADYGGELNGDPPKRHFIGNSFPHVLMGPGWFGVLGGKPGSGKTALAMQWAADALMDDPDLTAVVCNVEVPPKILRDRLLARASGVGYHRIRDRDLGDPETAERVAHGVARLESFADRIRFVQRPYGVRNIRREIDRAGPNPIVVADYIQRIAPDGDAAELTARERVNAVMDSCREWAEGGAAVVALSALSRGKGSRGSSYNAADDLAFFKESGEIEYAVDDALILMPDAEDRFSVEMLHLKCRHGEPVDKLLRFDAPRMTFREAEPAR